MTLLYISDTIKKITIIKEEMINTIFFEMIDQIADSAFDLQTDHCQGEADEIARDSEEEAQERADEARDAMREGGLV